MGMRIWLWKYTFLFTSGYGHDESAPTPNGVFVAHFVGVRWHFTDCSLAFHGLFVGILRNVRHVIANRSPRISCVFVAHSLVEYDVFVK